MIVAVYIRVSTTRQAVEGYSLDAQQKTLLGYCKDHHYSVYKVYADEGISGKDITHRPAFKKMIADAQNHLFDTVLVWKLTRFSRSIKDLINTCDILDKYNISLVSYSEAFDTNTPSGRMMRNLLGVIAQWEREIISENVKLANQEKIEQGYPLMTRVLGYDANSKELIINKREQKLVELIFETYIKEQNLSKTAQIINSDGYKGKNGHPFTAQSILTVLTNVMYCGYIKHHGKLYKGLHKSIINVETFNFVQKIIASNSKGRHRQHKLTIL